MITAHRKFPTFCPDSIPLLEDLAGTSKISKLAIMKKETSPGFTSHPLDSPTCAASLPHPFFVENKDLKAVWKSANLSSGIG
jgi:hypothetical protein